jgi:hypothetical protein
LWVTLQEMQYGVSNEKSLSGHYGVSYLGRKKQTGF